MYTLPRRAAPPMVVQVSNHSCGLRHMRAVEACPEVVYRAAESSFNSSCPIMLTDFEEGELVRRLPGGHLIAADSFERLVHSAREEGKAPLCPLTRVLLPPGVSETELTAFCTAPLTPLGLDAHVTRVPYAALGAGAGAVSASLGFDVSRHPDARSKVARDMQARLAVDAAEYARLVSAATVPRMLATLDAEAVVRGDRTAARSGLEALVSSLTQLRDRDAAYVREALPSILKRANTLESEAGSSNRPREVFALRQQAEQAAKAPLDFMFCLLISTQSESDLQTVNPFLTAEEARELLDLVVSCILHTSRVGQINRAVSEAHGLLRLLRPPPPSGARLGGARQPPPPPRPAKGDAPSPGGVAFGRTEVATAAAQGPASEALAAEAAEASVREAVSALVLKAQTLAEHLLTARHYVEGEAGRLRYDPRFLLFEFVHNLVLREAQVELVHEFVGAVRGGRPLVKQMLMGGGKTTVVGPLLALLLGDGKTLVVQTMPPALLEQSKATLRATFSSIVRKRVFTLSFDRSSTLAWTTVDKLQSAAHNRGVVLCTSATIKSLQLKLLEKMDVLRADGKGAASIHPSLEYDVRALVKVLQLMRGGCLIMDEVDLLLHPLKSELNFPIGERQPLDFSPERWTCAIHALDAVFYSERRSMSVPFHQSGRAHKILQQLQRVIEEGYEQRALQRSPHLVLLNVEWYHAEMKPMMAQWMMLWLEANHCAGISTDQIQAYITSDGTPVLAHDYSQRQGGRGAGLAPEQLAAADAAAGPDATDEARALRRLHAYCEAHIDTKAFKMLNLAAEWLRTYLPHCLQKIDRVSFGLLSVVEYAPAEICCSCVPSRPRRRAAPARPPARPFLRHVMIQYRWLSLGLW